MEQKSKKHILGLDIIRILAMILVVSVHATTFNHWADIRHDISLINFIATFGRYLSFACVPLFIVLTGFLSKEKTISRNYYQKIIRVLLEFTLSSILVGLFRIFYLDEVFSFSSFLKSLTTFSLAPYAWYINMYVGLFLFAPFLNLCYNSLPSKTMKTFFLAILVGILSLPSTIEFCAWNYWIVAYPIMFYFIGCYLKEFDLTIKKPYLILLLLITILCSTMISMFDIPFLKVENHNNIFCVITTVLIFKLLQSIDFKKYNIATNITTRMIRTISNASMSFFLVSYIFDQFFERKIFIAKGLTTFYDKFPHLFYTVPVTIVLSIILAVFVNYITKLFIKLWDIIFKGKACS